MALQTPDLTSTLILALSHSQNLTRQLDESHKIIDRLQRENQKLKHQIEAFRQEQAEQQKERDNAAQFATQLDVLFRRDAEKQIEIEKLRKRLAARDRALLHTPTPSSPLVSPINSEFSRKRLGKSLLLDETEILRELNVNSSPASQQAQRTKKLRSRIADDRGARAIPSIAEDGADLDENDSLRIGVEAKVPNETPGSTDGKNRETVNQRLDDLLYGHPQPPSASATSSTITPDPKIQSTAPAHEDEEPLRSRPLHRLNLTNFKINPGFIGDQDFTCQEVVRNREERRCLPACTKDCCRTKFGALAGTLPTELNMTEHDLLLEFLGAGAKDKILRLTPLARKNLVHEARTKKLADKYGRHKTSFEKADEAPDFWNSDMPSTQEHDKNKENAKVKERKEIERRYEEAMIRGRWLFVDE
jgi:hypothetical protein